MNRDSRLSGVLHVLLHMMAMERPVTSEALAAIMGTNPAVVRRTLAGLRAAGFVSSEKGHGGGWTVACDPAAVTLGDIYRAVGSPAVLAMGHRSDHPECLVEQAVNARLDVAFRAIEAAFMASLESVTLAALAEDFSKRFRVSGRAAAEHAAHAGPRSRKGKRK